jgi:hypothetical protein
MTLAALSVGVAHADTLKLADGTLLEGNFVGSSNGIIMFNTGDGIDSRRHQAGHRFRAQLESAIVIDGITAVPRGAFVHGRMVHARQAGRAVGSSELAIEFTDLMINVPAGTILDTRLRVPVTVPS